MKKSLVFSAVLLLLAVIFVTALADEPVNPYREEVAEEERMILNRLEENGSELESNNYYSGADYITLKGSKKPCQKLTFKAKLDGTGYTADQLVFRWHILDTGRHTGTMFSHNYDAGTSSFEYCFYSAGTYYAAYYAYPKEYEDSDYWARYVVVSGNMEFTIPEDGVHPTLEQRAQEIVNECKGLTKWDTALKLYEWLTGNCDYDYNYHLYGADIIFSGSGVCDAFSKAYMLLLNTAGIPANRAFGPDHAWNVLKLDGKWYQADPTWDDSGTHQFFCLSAKALAPVRAHSYGGLEQEGQHVTECTSMDANYFIHTGKWQEFGDYGTDQNNNYGWVSCADQARAKLAKGNTSFHVECWKRDGTWGGSSAFSYPSITGAVIEAGLNGVELLYGTDPIRVRTEPIDQTDVMVFISGWNIQETGTLTLPKLVTTVADEAYAGTRATTVIIPDGCIQICAGAFRNSSVRTVIIPDTVTTIVEGAFDGCGKIMFITENDAAESYAASHGILVAAP